MLRWRCDLIGRCKAVLLFLLVPVMLMGLGLARAEPVFQPLLAAHDMTALLAYDGMVFGGLDGGGLVVGAAGNLNQAERWYAGFGLSGNKITDLAWTGRNLWVATSDGGLTRVGNPLGAADFRQYTSNLGSLDVTAVTGTVIGQSERVFYGMRDGGLGQIVDGLSGNIYTAEQDGLLDNDINALVFFQDELFIATPSGVSRFANNVFTDVTTGLPGGGIADLVVTADDELLAATGDGVFSWVPAEVRWQALGDFGRAVSHLAAGSVGVFALATEGGYRLARLDNTLWRTVSLPQPRCSVVAAGQELWIAGRVTLPEMYSGNGSSYIGEGGAEGGFTTTIISASLVRNAEGVAFDSQGTAWVGSYVADSVSGLSEGQWSSIYALAADTDNDHGLFNYFSNILAMVGDLQGQLWISQYTTGLIRHDPVTATDTYFKPADSGMSGAYILDMVVHPDGPLIMTHDIPWQEGAVYPEKVDILLDTDHGEDPGQWLTLPLDQGGLTSINRIWSAVVERRDVIWFAAEDYGLVRWDINGDSGGPDDLLTWDDFSDDRWDGPFDYFPSSGNDPKKVKGLAVGSDGTLWAGGNGLVNFRYDESLGLITVINSYSEKVSNSIPGLVSGAVADVVVDGNGDIWATTTAGLNRLHKSGTKTTIDAWLDLANYLANPNYGLLYSSGVIAPLPGTVYRDLAVSPDGKRILLSADQGATLINVGNDGGAAEVNLAGVYCYPNPWLPAVGSGLLKLGNLSDKELGTDGVQVEVYNLEGQLVYRTYGVLPDEGFWDGRNRIGNIAVTGMYTVRVSWSGQTVVIPLSVVR